MSAHADKIIASLLATLTAAFFAIWAIGPGLAVYPPRLTVQSAFLAPLAHVGVRAGVPPSVILILTCAPVFALGFYIGVSWIRRSLAHALLFSVSLYLLAVAAAFLAGVGK